MKKIIFLCLSFSFLISCKKEAHLPKERHAIFTNVKIDTVLSESISIRAIFPEADTVWYAGNNGKYGYINLSTGKTFNGHIAIDTLLPEFRSIARTSHHVFILTAGSPALLYRISGDGAKVELVYREDNEKVFYDSMQFRNDTEGIAMGDPVSGCLSVIVTSDGGATWKKIPCDGLPDIMDGEAAFAASNSNLIVKGNKTWMVSGGVSSRVYASPDKGKTWNAYKVPVIQGKAMTGIFTADFYDADNGFIAGGDYEDQNRNYGNKAVTSDGGKTWRLTGEKQGFGYASCVQYVPHGNAEQLVCVGASGIQYSSDTGQTWKQLSGDKDLYTIRFLDDSTAIAAGKDKIVRIRFN